MSSGAAGRHRRPEDEPRPDPGPGPDAETADTREAVTGWMQLTWPEQLVGTALFVSVFMGLVALGIPGVSSRPWLLGPVLGVAYIFAGAEYAARTRLWRGPRRLGRLSGVRTLGKWLSATTAWFRPRGRRGFLAAACGVFVVVCGLLGAHSDKALVGDLRAHGQRASGVVEEVDHDLRGRREAVRVRFDTGPERPVSEPLRILDTVPDVATGDRVEVAFDPQDPGEVLLTSQLTNGHIVADYVFTALGGALCLGGLAWWFLRRRRDAETATHARDAFGDRDL